MTQTETLIAIEEIRKLKAAYFRCMDTKNWDEYPDLFTEDAIFDVRLGLEGPRPEADYENEKVVQGRAAIVDYVSAGLKGVSSVHHGHMPEIEILSPVTAKASWAMYDLLALPPGGPFRVFHGYGHYFETYIFSDRWRIATLKLRRLYVETT